MAFLNKLFKSGNATPSADLTTITRTEVLEGFSIPGIINNLDYHFTDIQVYSDGLIYCWEMVDLQLLKDKLSRKWIVTSIPNGQALSIFSLGRWNIEKGHWLYNNDTFYDYIQSLVKRLNPEMENLHNYKGTNTRTINNVNMSKHSLSNPLPYYNSNPDSLFPKKIYGNKFFIFYRNTDDKTYLAELSIYKNGLVEITHLPTKKSFQFEELKSLMDQRHILTELSQGQQINIMGLGHFTIASGSGVRAIDKYNEFENAYNVLRGLENSINKCARIFEEYKQNPSIALKKALKEAYLAVPEHQRIFVGNMDTKDYEVRLIIYGDSIKKDWEDHYGFPYPFEDMPKPADE